MSTEQGENHPPAIEGQNVTTNQASEPVNTTVVSNAEESEEREALKHMGRKRKLPSSLFQEGEITAIMNEFERPGTHATLFIGGTSYNVVQGIDGSVIRARLEGANNDTGITIMKTRAALVIGIYDRSPVECSTIVESLGNHFIDYQI